MTLTVRNRQGLHARPAAQFVRVAGQFPDCDLTVRHADVEVNGKSIMGMMMLAAGPGTELTIITEGRGAADLATQLKDLVDSGFGEDMAP